MTTSNHGANLRQACSSAVILDTQKRKELLHIYLNDLNFYVLIGTWLVSAHPHVNVISGGPWQLPVEPWRVVEGAACVGITPSLLPQSYVIKTSSCTSITEIVGTYK